MKRDALTLLVLLGACQPDLPDGWEEAIAVDDFSQDECDDTGGTPPDVEATVTASEDEPGIRLVGEDVRFHCSQEVEGFYRTTSEAIEVLVQPVNMNPSSVVKCDCYYRIEAGIPEDAPATVSLYRRSDHYGNDPVETNVPTLIATVEVP